MPQGGKGAFTMFSTGKYSKTAKTVLCNVVLSAIRRMFNSDFRLVAATCCSALCSARILKTQVVDQ